MQPRFCPRHDFGLPSVAKTRRVIPMTAFEQANQNARTGQETLEASSRVIAKRLTIMSEALADPLHADHAELSRMGTEKVVAMTAATEALIDGAVDLTRTSYSIAEREADLGSSLINQMSQARSLTDVALLQAQWGMAAWGRAFSDSQALTLSLLDTQARALKPIHGTVTRNASRLKA